MCIAAPGKVIKRNGGKATVQYDKETREVLLGEENAAVGDYVLVQMGIVIKVLTPAEAKESLQAWNQVN
jgi:hydrogenase expression/formation protein HypC